MEVFDAMPSVGRKFLLAGVGGMNITHSEPYPAFVGRYGERRDALDALLRDFDGQALRQWIHGLGIETFVGTSGRVFPTDMKAAPLLRAWLKRHTRHRWLGWTAEGALRIGYPQGERHVHAQAVVLALGGGSWARLGSDGAWVPVLAAPEQLRVRGRGLERGAQGQVRWGAAEEHRPERAGQRAAQGRVHPHGTRGRG